MSNKHDREKSDDVTTPGTPLRDDDTAKGGSQNPGPTEGRVSFGGAGQNATPGNPLHETDLEREGSMNPGPAEDSDGNVAK